MTTIETTTTHAASTRYLAPNWFDRRVVQPFVSGLTRLGVGFWGARLLEHVGRKSGKTYFTPVNLLDLDGAQFLVAPRGTTDWVRNVRERPSVTLLVGRRRQPATLVELFDQEKPAVLRAYLRRWRWEVGQFFDGVDADSADAALLEVAPGHPVFRVDESVRSQSASE